MTLSNASTTLRISPYARISDTDEERAPGIDRQLRTVLPLIEGRGGVATREYIDNDKSAYKADVVRDQGFEPWLADFVTGKTDGIAAFDLDRLFRQTTDLNRVIQAFCHAYFKEDRPKPVLWLPSGSIDLTDEDGQMMATVLVAMAKNSSGKTAKRVTAFYRDKAIQGNVYTNYPAFYRNQDGSINQQRSAIALEAVDDVLYRGKRPAAIAAEWRLQGITTARGGHVNGETVRRILISPGMAGLAVYKREILVDDDGSYIKRRDGGIIDEPTWHALCAKLQTKPGTRNRMTKGLLSPKLRCGKCGAGMARRQQKRKHREPYFTYECRSVDSGGCAGVAISGPKLDVQITELVLAYLRDPVEVEDKAFDGQARLDEVSGLIGELMAKFRSKELSGSVVFPSVSQLEQEQRALRREAAKYTRAQTKITTAADEWPNLGLDRQQAVIDMIFETIVILPAKHAKVGIYDSERAQPVYRKLDAAELQKRLTALLSPLPRS